MKKNDNFCKNQHVNVEKRDHETIIYIVGDFDNATTPMVHECCKTIQKDDGAKRIVLDLKDAGRVDSSAFACIINYIKEHKGSAAEISVANLPDRAAELLHILKIEKIIHATRASSHPPDSARPREEKNA